MKIAAPGTKWGGAFHHRKQRFLMTITQHTINGVDPQLQLRAGTLHAAEYEPLLPVTPQRASAKQPQQVAPLNCNLAIRGPPGLAHLPSRQPRFEMAIAIRPEGA